MACHSRLLGLPREIRNEIYKLLFQSSNHRPVSPEEAGPRFKDIGCVLYPLDSPTPANYAPLLQCSRQLRSEVLEHLESKQDGVYRLDCMLNAYQLWPTWITFPGLARNMRHVEMEFRLFDVGDGGGLFWGCGGPGMAFKPLFRLLNRFIHHGPQFYYTGPLSYEVRLESLRIDVVFVDRYEDKHTGDTRTEDDHDWDRKRVFRSIASNINLVARLGLLTGKISKITVRLKDFERVIETEEFKPQEHVPKDWDAYGYHWAVEPVRLPRNRVQDRVS